MTLRVLLVVLAVSLVSACGPLVRNEQVDGPGPLPQEEKRLHASRPVEEGRQLGTALGKPVHIRCHLAGEKPLSVPPADLDQGPTVKGRGPAVEREDLRWRTTHRNRRCSSRCGF